MNLKNIEVMESSLKKPVVRSVVVSSRSKLAPLIVTSVAIGATAPAFADFDPSTIVTIISGFVAGVSAIGLAVLSLVVTGKVFKWVRTAL